MTGVTVIIGVMLSDQFPSMPVVPVWVLVSWSVQVPVDRRSARDRWPSRARAGGPGTSR